MFLKFIICLIFSMSLNFLNLLFLYLRWVFFRIRKLESNKLYKRFRIEKKFVKLIIVFFFFLKKQHKKLFFISQSEENSLVLFSFFFSIISFSLAAGLRTSSKL